MQWLAQLPPEQCPMIVHIQETHWSHDQEYSTPGWHITSSACPSPKAGGLLTLVSAQLCSANQISSSSRVAGRLLHVRIDLGDRTVDAINTYQKVYHSGSTRIEKGQTQIAADQRRDVWTSLRGLLKEIPIRHHLILSGDFNSPAPLIPELVGSKARAFRTPMVPDLAALEALLVDFQLLHLNSWTRRAGPTFISPQGASQIDHVFVRKAAADMPARGGSPCNWPLAAWRQGGRHRPVQVSLPIRPYRALGKSQPKRALLDLQGLRNACRDPSHPGIRQLRASVEALLSDSPEATVEEVNSHVLQKATAVFPAVRNQGRVVPWQSPTVELSVKGMWQAYHCWRHGPTTGRRNVFALWRAYSAFRRAHKQFRQRTREAKRAWFHDQILGMERASAAGDVRALFRLAGALLPKQPRRKLQLRGPNGELWSSTQQVDCLKTFFQDLYAPEDEPALPPLPPLQAPTISSSEAHHRLAKLPVHKATPAHQAPTAAVVACADLLAPWLSDKVGSLSSFPAVWSDCWLALMPKVSHPVLPRQLRPIGLTESTSRVLAGHLQDALKPYLQAFVGPWPQLAYMAGRSTGEALHRVFSHCHEVSAANLKPAYNIHRAREKLAQAGKPSSPSSASKRQRTGGVQASLDLSQAFDRLSWSLIHEALLEAQVPIELRVQLLEFYRGLGYHLTFGSEQATVHALRGVKQGCKVAPLLWSLATGLLMRRLARATSSEWVRRALTAFADDFHIGQVVHSTRDLLLSIDRLGHVLQLLIDARMKVNIDKSVILLSVNHSYASRWRRREILSGKVGPRLRIPTPTAGTFKMPIVTTHKYLGAIISYQEDCTQLTAHLTGESTIALHHRLRVPLVLDALRQASHRRAARWAAIPPEEAHLLNRMWQARIDDALQKLDSPLQPLLEVTTAPSTSFALQDNPSTTGALESGMQEEGWSCLEPPLLAECPAAHSCPNPASSSSPPGQPTAAATMADAEDILSIRHQPVSQPLAYTPAFQTQLRRLGWQALLSRPDLRSSLKHHCPLCSQWTASPSGLKVHLQQSHPEWKALRPESRIDLQHHWKQCYMITLLSFLECWLNNTFPAIASTALDQSDQRELGLFQNFMTPPAGMDAAQLKRRRGEEPEAQQALFLNHSSGSQASASTMTFASTSLEPKGKGKGKQPKGKGRGKGGKSRPAAQQSWNDQWSSDQSWSSGHSWTSSGDLTGQMARLLLRHEQQLQSIQQDCKLHLYLRSGKESFLPNLCEIAKEWSRLRRDEPGKINSPLRTLLLKAILQEMETRIKLTISKEKQAAIDMQWYKEEEGWTYMQWNAQKGQLELQAAPSPLATETLLELLRELRTLVNPDSVKKFASLRGLPQEPQSEWIHFQLELGFRPQGDRMWEIFQMLLNQSCLHPLGAPCGPNSTGGRRLVKSTTPLASTSASSGIRRFLRMSRDLPLDTACSSPSFVPTEVPSHFQPLLHAVLHNADGTACYMNTALIALLWAIGCHDPTRSGSLSSLYQCLTARSDLRLMRNMCWTMLLGNWARPNQQHDMHEFLLHLMPRVRLEAFSGLWQTRRLEDTGTVICASSNALLPVTLDLPLEARGLQHCVQEWSAQHYHTAFNGNMPHLICLHLSRYRRDDERGIFSKDDQALPDWSEVIRIPQFAMSHDIQKHWRPYQVCAMALHYGPALHQGHYRCLTRWGQNPVRVWLHDDNHAAEPLSLPDSVELSRKAYLLWAMRMD
ncbi:unnamed protein product [Symbiodinium sp. CCMP2592]|nr:unnamed protein product [Symbiodinium sp. CCMP2592]